MRFYSRDGEEITLEQWSALLGNHEYQRVARTEFADILVSTVWLGMDHAWGGPPLIFETMIFGGELDQEQWRYGTEAEALDGHAAAVEQARVAHQLSLPAAEVERGVDAEEQP